MIAGCASSRAFREGGPPNRRHRSIPVYAPKLRDEILRPVLRAVIDARNLNGVLLYLVDDNVRRKNQFAPPAHASGTAAMGKILQRATAVLKMAVTVSRAAVGLSFSMC